MDYIRYAFWSNAAKPCDILFGRRSDTPSSPNEYMNNLEARFESVYAFARERIKLSSERSKTRSQIACKFAASVIFPGYYLVMTNLEATSL
ncbi:hypothetical protein AVEN_53459-1 [Araneus ventricosus]|uniref:Uncharacterized protein n=1 Tax=Araneus ventricosus TaxID=182803 RepID=A0A4Y2AA90_ARAVE|nr:hypothetical protein AVEN_53459-1 [Araneus ventricosus]